MLQEKSVLPVGMVLRERYVIKQVLGSGENGAVYLVKDQQIKRLKYNLVVLKEITSLDDHERSQFTFNSVILRQLQHPALPRIQHVFNDRKRGRVYLVMDYVTGRSLAEQLPLQVQKRFSWGELKTLAQPVVEALHYLHTREQPFFHGDIKPANLMLSETGQMFLVDLNYAQVSTSTLPHTSSAATHFCYRAPEYLPGKIDEFIDVYGLGATLYHLLTGQAPPDALTRLKGLAKKNQSDLLKLASEVAPEVSPALAAELQHALALDPDERFASIEDFWQALNALPVEVEALAEPSDDLEDSEITTKLSLKPEISLEEAVESEPDTISDESPELPVTPVQTVASPLTVASINPPLGSTSTPKKKKHGIGLLRVAIICAILLLLVSAGAGFWASMHNQGSSPVAQLASPGTTSTQATEPVITATARLTGYSNLLGRYTGIIAPLGLSSGNLSLIILQQREDQIGGTFISPQQSGHFSGTVDAVGNVKFTVQNSSGQSVFAFTGGLNGSPDLTDSMGGIFYSCPSTSDLDCQSHSHLSGTWSLSNQASTQQ